MSAVSRFAGDRLGLLDNDVWRSCIVWATFTTHIYAASGNIDP